VTGDSTVNQQSIEKGNAKMKNIIAFSLTLLAITLLLTFNIALAGERVRADELAESGITIELQMTPEEIAVEEEENSRPASLNVANGNKLLEIVEVFEMGQSGQTLSFPLTAEEITADDARNAGFAILRCESER
jgi:hypothetical protein